MSAPNKNRGSRLCALLVGGLLVGGALLARASAVLAQTAIVGTVATVKDGDDIRVCNGQDCIDIRLCGIDAPEMKHTAGAAARAALKGLVAGKVVRCIPVGQGSVCDGRSRPINRGRVIAQCFVDDRDVADDMMKKGHACDWEKYSGGHYRRFGGKPC